MNENRTIHLVDIPIGGKSGLLWNRLHGEREDICEALVKDTRPVSNERRAWLQTRLRKIDDALDRLMSGSYGNCSNCGQSIDDAKLENDATLAFCLDCSGGEVRPHTSSFDGSDIVLNSLKPFDTVLLRTYNNDYRILLLEPSTGRALVEGGHYLVEPCEAVVRGSAVPGDPFKPGTISIDARLEIWVDERVFLTSNIKSVYVKHSGDAESVEAISEALH